MRNTLLDLKVCTRFRGIWWIIQRLTVAAEEKHGIAVKLEHGRLRELRSIQRVRMQQGIRHEPDPPKHGLEAVFWRNASFKAVDQYLVRGR